jgi:hypothetical protein
MPEMAGKRVRMANILVELVNRRPIRVVRQTYFVAGFDQAGRLDAERFERQQLALVESALYPVFSTSNDDDPILPDGHPNSPVCGHLKFPHPDRASMRR